MEFLLIILFIWTPDTCFFSLSSIRRTLSYICNLQSIGFSKTIREINWTYFPRRNNIPFCELVVYWVWGNEHFFLQWKYNEWFIYIYQKIIVNYFLFSSQRFRNVWIRFLLHWHRFRSLLLSCLQLFGSRESRISLISCWVALQSGNRARASDIAIKLLQELQTESKGIVPASFCILNKIFSFSIKSNYFFHPRKNTIFVKLISYTIISFIIHWTLIFPFHSFWSISIIRERIFPGLICAFLSLAFQSKNRRDGSSERVIERCFPSCHRGFVFVIVTFSRRKRGFGFPIPNGLK